VVRQTTSWPSGLRRCVKAAVFLAWVRIPPKSFLFVLICIMSGVFVMSIGYLLFCSIHFFLWGLSSFISLLLIW
ncbi:hypothetical protein ACHAXR_005279, partial [Thalassiosira sp. AJA248-18]